MFLSFSPMTILVALYWACSSMPMFLVSRGAQSRIHTPDVLSQVRNGEEGSLALLANLLLAQSWM